MIEPGKDVSNLGWDDIYCLILGSLIQDLQYWLEKEGKKAMEWLDKLDEMLDRRREENVRKIKEGVFFMGVEHALRLEGKFSFDLTIINDLLYEIEKYLFLFRSWPKKIDGGVLSLLKRKDLFSDGE